jgi:large subunit ribosomal protein L4
VADDDKKTTPRAKPAGKPAKPAAKPAKTAAKPAKTAAKTAEPPAAKTVRAARPKAAPTPKKPTAKPASKSPAAPEAKKPVAKPTAARVKPKAKAAQPRPATVRAAKKPAAKAAAETPAAEVVAAETAVPEETKPKAAPRAARPRAAAPRATKATKAAAPQAKAPRLKSEKPKLEPVAGTAGKANVVDAAGQPVAAVDLKAALFAVPADVNTLHLVVRAEQAARRRGSASTKTRGEVTGSTAKLYRQKGTGRARVGSAKSPTRVGGGIAFGPKPRRYDIKVNRKVVRKALAMALSSRAETGNVFVVRDIGLDKPSTARMNDLLVGLNIAVPVLVVTRDEPQVALSARNLRYAETTEVGALSTEQVLRARSLILTEKAFDALNEA